MKDGQKTKDQTVALLGILIILFVATGIFLAHPKGISNKARVAGVRTEEDRNSMENFWYQSGRAVNDAKVNISESAQSGEELTERLEKAVKKKKETDQKKEKVEKKEDK